MPMPPFLIVDISAFTLSIALAASLIIMVLGSMTGKSMNVFFALYALSIAGWAVSSLLLRVFLWFHAGNPQLLLEFVALFSVASGSLLLLFTTRFLGMHSRWTDAVSIATLGLVAVLSPILLFRHRIIFDAVLLANGTVIHSLSAWAYLAIAVPLTPIAISLILLSTRRLLTNEAFVPLSVLLLFTGFVLGGLTTIKIPIMSYTHALGVGILGIGVVRRQLFNPLRELTDQLGKRADRLELIARIGQKTTARLGLDDLLQQSVALIRGTFQCFDVAVLLIEGDRLVLRASSLPRLQALAGTFSLKVGEGVTGLAAETGEPVLVPDVRKEPSYVFISGNPTPGSELAVPLKLRGKTIGVLNLESSQVDAFTPLDVATQQTIADQLANAIDNVQLYDKAMHRAERLAVITRISAAVGAVLNIPDLLESVYREVAPIFDADAFFIALYDEEKDELDFRIRVDEGIRETPDRKRVGPGLTSRIIKEKKPLLVNDMDRELKRIHTPIMWGTGKIPSSWLGVPMLIGERPIGVISVQTYKPRPYDEEDRRLLGTIADQVAVAVENARLYEALKLELAERKRTETGLRESEEQFRNLAEQSPNMIFINQGGQVVYANRQCEMTTGYKREEFYAPHALFLQLTAPEYRSVIEDNFHRHMGSQEVSPYEYAFFTRDGHRIDAIITTKLIHHAGEPAILGIITDITARKRTERLLRSLNAAALAMEEALAPKEIFPAAVRELSSLGFSCAVFLVDPSKTKVAMRYASGRTPGDAVAFPEQPDGADGWVPIDGASILAEVLGNRQTVLTGLSSGRPSTIAAVKGSAPWLVENATLRNHSILSPLCVGEDVFGFLAVNGESLGEEDTQVIAAFAHQTAAAWRKTALMQDLEGSLTELRTTQDLLLHAQKMEAIGRLAGGIAHDFNNVLTVISGYTSLLTESMQDNEAALADLTEIKGAIKRASALTSRLLAFSRRQILQPEVLDLDAVLSGCAKLLRPLIGEDIEMVIRPTRGLGRIKADPFQIDQVVINLAVNARDAMPAGGTLILETSNRVLHEEDAAALSVSPGPFVTLTVRDTGVGMTGDIMSRIFEPFFTTKEDGKGTGLGLSTVYGIVKQTGGAIHVESVPGKGSVFTIYIPQVAEEKPSSQPAAREELTPPGTGTVLLVEDDETVRSLAARILENAGYNVLVAASGEEAIQAAADRSDLRLMITDVVMPGMNGVELSQQLGKSLPRMPVLFMSGYTDDPSIHIGVPDGLPFLSKPFHPEELLKKAAEMIAEED